MKKTLSAMATDNVAQGLLQVNVVSIVNNFPIQNANVRITYKGNPDSTVEQVSTNSSGQTEQVSLDAPPLELSLTPGIEQPYSEYNLLVTAPGYKPVEISGTEVLPDATAIQPVAMEPDEDNQPTENPIVIPDHTLYGNYPPKIAESEIKPVGESGEIVLSRVVVPQTVVVHDGVPTDPTASNYYVPYRDYIKNVASSEIYATWPRSTITANVLAIMSFTLNRVYTEWYRNQGYDFTITSSTAFDHKWIYGRNIFDSISEVVDEIFDNYLSRPEVKQPILTQYCDGRKVTCPNWMTKLKVRIRIPESLILSGFRDFFCSNRGGRIDEIVVDCDVHGVFIKDDAVHDTFESGVLLNHGKMAGLNDVDDIMNVLEHACILGGCIFFCGAGIADGSLQGGTFFLNQGLILLVVFQRINSVHIRFFGAAFFQFQF